MEIAHTGCNHDWETAYIINRSRDLELIVEGFLRNYTFMYVTKADLNEIVHELGHWYPQKVCLNCKKAVDEYDGVPAQIEAALTEIEDAWIVEEQRRETARKIWDKGIIE